MNGKTYLLDTNAIIALLRGNKVLLRTLKNAKWVGVSVISVLEFLSFPGLTGEDKTLLEELLVQVNVVGIEVTDSTLIETTVNLRKSNKLKLPDAIIAATAIEQNATLITQDRDFQSIENLPILAIKA